MNGFRKRYYDSPRAFCADLRFIAVHLPRVLRLALGKRLTTSFRERLMLSVTTVNGCRYCAYYHMRAAFLSGLGRDEILALREGGFKNSPPAEVPALLYAWNWAETGGAADSQADVRLRDVYGEETAHDIRVVLGMIRMGNMIGNTFDYLLYRLGLYRTKR